MNELKNIGLGLIGSEEALKKIAIKERVKILVISDTHGNSDVFEDVVFKFGIDCDVLVFCGDGICDLESYLRHCFTKTSMRNFLPSVIAFVRGNGDPPGLTFPCSLIDDKKVQVTVPSSVQLKVAGQTVLAIHGHQLNVYLGTEALENWAAPKKPAAVFFGHTHIPEKNIIDGCLYLNPGSATRPRSSTDPTLSIVTLYQSGVAVPTFFSAE